MTRPTFDQTMMRLARLWAERATCPRKAVGCVIERDGQVVASGYNGAARGLPHCSDRGVGCLLLDDKCARAIHAEANAIAQAARLGVSVAGATIHCTHGPCSACARLIVAAGIVRVRWSGGHGEVAERIAVAELLAASGVAVEQETGA